MRFGKRFEKAKIPAWEGFYVSYDLLKEFLSPFKFLTNDPLSKTKKVDFNKLSTDDIQKLQGFIKRFEQVIVHDMKKIVAFFNVKVNKEIIKWRKVRINLLIFQKKKIFFTKKVKEEHWSKLKYSFEGVFKRVKLLNEYVLLNLEAFEKVIQRQIKLVKPFFPQITSTSKFEKYYVEMKMYEMRDLATNFSSSLENEYLDYFHKNRSTGVKEINKIEHGSLLSKNGSFWFGLFLGCTILLVVVIILLAVNGSANLGNQEFLNRAFPIYRMLAIIFLYIMLIGWNIYAWISYHVNYKYIFCWKHHHSELWQVLKMGSIFTTILLISFVWYLILQNYQGKIAQAFDFIPKDILPLIVIGIFLAYLLFPTRRKLNGRGRRHVRHLIADMFKPPFIPVVFTIIWATDQFTSMAQPLKDFEYTVCFYVMYFTSDESGIQECYSYKRATRSLVMPLIPNVLRMLQCLRLCYDVQEKKWLPLINFGKYLSASTITVMSYMVNIHDDRNVAFIVLWIIAAAVSAVYSYLWDLKMDWGLLVPNAKFKFLRNQISYKNPWKYYFVMIIDIALRFVGQMSLSTPVVTPVMSPALYQFVIALVAIIQRIFWNFFRVEKEHLDNLKGYHVVLYLVLPYEAETFETKEEEEQFDHDLKAVFRGTKGGYIPLHKKKQKKLQSHKSCVMNTVDLLKHNQNDSFQVMLSKEDIDQPLYELQLFCEKPLSPISNLNTSQLTKKIVKYDKEADKILVQVEKWKKEVEEFNKDLRDRNQTHKNKMTSVANKNPENFSQNKNEHQIRNNELNSSQHRITIANLPTLSTKGNEQEIIPKQNEKESFYNKAKKFLFGGDLLESVAESRPKSDEGSFSMPKDMKVIEEEQNFPIELIGVNENQENSFKRKLSENQNRKSSRPLPQLKKSQSLLNTKADPNQMKSAQNQQDKALNHQIINIFKESGKAYPKKECHKKVDANVPLTDLALKQNKEENPIERPGYEFQNILDDNNFSDADVSYTSDHIGEM